ncbi:hypothetical protein CRE_08040 [Caenorhabditis remanei]|uniref:Uncharacterized protein n=1 Tax=Caenorhabditis remanei TaxID=31234 RepID=E3M3Z2_CAERE|nr:hypothetical protein CRE_08040 [Caenorhabditis remanei]
MSTPHINIVKILIQAGANLLAVNAEGNMPYDICDHEETLDVIESEMAARGITQSYIDEMRGAPEKAMLDDMKMFHQQRRELDLHVASANGYYDVAAFLLTCSVSPLIRDNDFWQPVHAAACWAQPDLIELLCQYGGDIHAKTKNGKTPIELCEDLSTKQVIATLVQSEARRRRLAFGARDSISQRDQSVSVRRKRFNKNGKYVKGVRSREYNVCSTFKSHEPEFDYLKSLEGGDGSGRTSSCGNDIPK